MLNNKSKPRKTLLSLFTKVNDGQPSNGTSSMCNIDASSSPPKSQRVEFEKVDTPSTIDTPYLECDPELYFSISAFC